MEASSEISYDRQERQPLGGFAELGRENANAVPVQFAPAGGPCYETPKLATPEEILELIDRNVAAFRNAVSQLKDEDVKQMWSLLAGTSNLHHATHGGAALG